MGFLADTAKKNSNWLIINKGETALVRYLDARVVPNKQDPSKDAIQYKFSQDGKDKYWDNGNGKIMLFFDTLPKDSFVKISRNPWINKDGSEDTGKSQYVVEKVEEKKGK